MKAKHLLLSKVRIYERRELKDPDDCEYHNILGGWLCGINKEFLVKSNNSNYSKTGTKKEDVETGEDLKGE